MQVNVGSSIKNSQNSSNPNAGAFNLNANNATSNSNSNIGTETYKMAVPTALTLPLGRTLSIQYVLVLPIMVGRFMNTSCKDEA